MLPAVHSFQDAYLTPAGVVGPQQHTGAVYAGGRLIEASLRLTQAAWKSADPLEANGDTETALSEAVYLGHFFSHFGHMLVETLPTFVWAERFPDLPLVFHRWPAENQARTIWQSHHVVSLLELCGIRQDRVVLVEEPMRVRKLHIPPRPIEILTGPKYDYSAILKRVGEAAGEESEAAPRVYFSRRKWGSPIRSFSNEAEVEEMFERHGFQIVVPESISFRAQVRLVGNAKMIAGLDGSALHLGMFMRPGSTMMVLESRKVPIIYKLNELAGVQTTGFDVCTTTKTPTGTDTVVDVSRLESLLTPLL